MEMLLFRFVRTIRSGELFLYEKSFNEIADWAFILDHYNYARWLPVRVRDTMNLRVKPRLSIDSLLMDVSQLPKRKTLSQ